MSVKFKIEISNSVRKSLFKIPIDWRRRVIEAIEGPKNDPFYGRRMMGVWQGKWKIIVWPYRIFYTIDGKDNIIRILKIYYRGNTGYK